MKQLIHICILLLLVTMLGACSTINFYSQAISGHLTLMMAAKPIDDLLAQPDIDPALQKRLALAMEARRFAETQLALPVGDAYLKYVALDRPYVVVNLVTVPEFSLAPHRWCYPIVGCQSYRGYFNLKDAQEEEQRFADMGYDTLIGGVTAYSTLGWFDDPLHSGFTALSEDQMVALMFHELAHREVYIKKDTAFNESFATAVELEGLRLWLEQRGDQAGFERALTRLRQRNQTLPLVKATTDQLQALYRQRPDLSKDELRKQKSTILAQLVTDYRALSADWGQPGPFGRDPTHLNNANLALFRQYNQYVPGFRQLLKNHDYDFAAFYDSVRELAQQSQGNRIRALLALNQLFDEDL